MPLLSSVSDLELRERLSAAVSSERAASTDVVFIFHSHATRPAAIPRLRQARSEFIRLGRTVYLVACSSLTTRCVERLGYSEDGANKRVRVARLAQRFPQILDELASGNVHLTGLFLLSRHLTEDNVEQLLAEARGKSKRQLEELIARWSPQPDVPTTLTTMAPEPAQTELSTVSGTGCAGRCSWSRQRQRRGHQCERVRGSHHDSKGTHQAEAHRHAAETHRRGAAHAP
ncbi:MAG: hypothetical protein IPI67_06865 [Myxococcales bacterium]|nr:hypothetical protein [Myxococcales bacterium]